MAENREADVQVDNLAGHFNHHNDMPNTANHRLGTVRDRLFHAMVVKIAVSYSSIVSYHWRRFIEFSILFIAIFMLSTLVYVHFTHSRYPGTCLSSIKHNWPKKGILRVEVINNLKEFEQQFYDEHRGATKFSMKEILMKGPKAIPADAKSGSILSTINFSFSSTDDFYPGDTDVIEIEPAVQPIFTYVVEFSPYHGLLKLPTQLRRDYNVDQMLYRIDGENDPCFGNWRGRFFVKYLIGVDDLIMSSLRSLTENDTEKGYLRDLITGEHYHFVTTSVSKASYFSALLIMMIFTFAISMLLRFSHHQIFLFIVDLLQMFELNEPLVFPIAPLLTVILALVGMEAIMSEIFNDTSTAFYVILLVWMADQYDAIVAKSAISRKHWLRFFYLYHFAFYAYQYKYSGQHNVFALLTSAMFILHTMVFFFHHYEIPLILYQEQLVRVVSAVHQESRLHGNTAELILINRGDQRSSNNDTSSTSPAQQLPNGEAATEATNSVNENAAVTNLRPIRPLQVKVTTEQNTSTRNGDSQSSHRSIVFSLPQEPEQLPALKRSCATSCSTTSAESSEAAVTREEMTSEQQERRTAELVAEQVVESIMTELFDASQLEEHNQ
ncbi:hypothetical protein M3Y97_00600000 [Aphelenchoides bicaudatus]|nr:hypothetical protein M3Y97_00600000 [Aphelenchoides bicaudatus]